MEPRRTPTWRQAGGGAAGGRTWLDVVEDLVLGGADGPACHVRVDLIVDIKGEGGEDTHDAVVVAVVTAAGDAAVDAEAEEWEPQGRDVVHVADDDAPTPHVDRNGAATGDRHAGVVGQSDVLAIDSMVADEGVVVWPEVVGGTAVENGDLSAPGPGCR